jgi:hypothetical protein
VWAAAEVVAAFLATLRSVRGSPDGGVVKHIGPGSKLLDDPEVGRLYLGVRAAVPTG